jgi:hypothetical protein
MVATEVVLGLNACRVDQWCIGPQVPALGSRPPKEPQLGSLPPKTGFPRSPPSNYVGSVPFSEPTLAPLNWYGGVD